MRSLLLAPLACLACLSQAAELRWGFASADGMPYVDVQGQQLRGGFTHRLGTRVSQDPRLELPFIEIPNKRQEKFIHRGRIHLTCNANPGWAADPSRYHWSPPLYQDEDVLLLHEQYAPIDNLEGLYGAVLGSQLRYVYSAPLMEAFARQLVSRQNIRDLDSMLNMLSNKRIDVPDRHAPPSDPHAGPAPCSTVTPHPLGGAALRPVLPVRPTVAGQPRTPEWSAAGTATRG